MSATSKKSATTATVSHETVTAAAPAADVVAAAAAVAAADVVTSVSHETVTAPAADKAAAVAAAVLKIKAAAVAIDAAGALAAGAKNNKAAAVNMVAAAAVAAERDGIADAVQSEMMITGENGKPAWSPTFASVKTTWSKSRTMARELLNGATVTMKPRTGLPVTYTAADVDALAAGTAVHSPASIYDAWKKEGRPAPDAKRENVANTTAAVVEWFQTDAGRDFKKSHPHATVEDVFKGVYGFDVLTTALQDGAKALAEKDRAARAARAYDDAVTALAYLTRDQLDKLAAELAARMVA